MYKYILCSCCVTCETVICVPKIQISAHHYFWQRKSKKSVKSHLRPSGSVFFLTWNKVKCSCNTQLCLQARIKFAAWCKNKVHSHPSKKRSNLFKYTGNFSATAPTMGCGAIHHHHHSPSVMLGSLWSCNASRHFAAASVEVRCQTGRSSSTTMVSPAALSLLHLRLARCSAQTDCRGRIDPMCPMWGRDGRRYRAPQEPGWRERVKMKSKRSYPVDLPFHLPLIKQNKKDRDPTFDRTKSTRPALFRLYGR